MRHGIAIIGAPAAGKSTFRAVNYHLFQTFRPSRIIVEPDPEHPDTGILFDEWEKTFNRGDFPEKSGVSPIREIHVNFWKEDKKVKVVELDPGGEVWLPFDPIFSDNRQLEPKLIKHLQESIGILVIIDPELAQIQDSFYQNVLINIKNSMDGYSHENLKPVFLVLTKMDKIKFFKRLNLIKFLEKEMPKTFGHFVHFFSNKNNLSERVFGCSIGKVIDEGRAIKIFKFSPKGFVEVLIKMFELTRFFEE